MTRLGLELIAMLPLVLQLIPRLQGAGMQSRVGSRRVQTATGTATTACSAFSASLLDWQTQPPAGALPSPPTSTPASCPTHLLQLLLVRLNLPLLLLVPRSLLLHLRSLLLHRRQLCLHALRRRLGRLLGRRQLLGRGCLLRQLRTHIAELLRNHRGLGGCDLGTNCGAGATYQRGRQQFWPGDVTAERGDVCCPQ